MKFIRPVISIVICACLSLGVAQAQESAETLAEQEKAANYQPATNRAPRALEGAGSMQPLFVGLDDSTVPAYTVNPDTDANSEAFDGVEVWGAAYDADNHQVYISEGVDLWVWPADGGVPVFLATVQDTTDTSVVMEGLAYYEGTLYASKVSSTGEGEGIYEVDLTTFEATRVITYADDTQTTISGIDADPDTGTLYGTNDNSALRGLVQIDPDGTVTVVTPYVGDETDVDGLAVGGGRAYLITDDQTPPDFMVWDFGSASYVDGVMSPFTTTEVFAGGAWIATEGGGGGEPEPRATFGVQKVYDDLNPTPVEITLSCNTGLPIEQTVSLEPDPTGGEYVEFVVNDFESGTLDCEVTEELPGGYFGVYVWAEEGNVFQGEDGCFFQDVVHGDFADTTPSEEDNFCIVVNVLQPSVVTVNKEWIDENPGFNNPTYAEANWFCSNLPDFVGGISFPPLGSIASLSSLEGSGNTDSGNLVFFGNPGVDSFSIPGNWDGGTICSITEQVVESGVEADDSDCQNLVIGPGEDVECTIVNTRLYEGIPTLSQYGLGLLALLMLGMGFVAVRRFV